MSTKIYNGYVLPNMNLLELKHFCCKLDIERKNAIDKFVKKHFFQSIISFIDKLILEPDKNDIFIDRELKNDNLFFMTYFDFCKMIEHDSESKEYGLFDLKMTICFLPMKDKILALLYCNNRDLTKVFTENELVSEYCYFNNSDKPDEISEVEWEKRRIEWEEVLTELIPNASKGYAAPCDVGLCYEPDYLNYIQCRVHWLFEDLFKEFPEIINKELRSEKFLNNNINLFKKYNKNIDVVKRFCDCFKNNFGVDNFFKTEDEIRNFFIKNIVSIPEDLFKNKIGDVKKEILSYYGKIVNENIR